MESRAFGFDALIAAAPVHFRSRLIEMRNAALENRAAPPPSAEYMAESAEQRFLVVADAAPVEQRFFPTTVSRRHRLPSGVCFEDVLALQASKQTRSLRARASKMAAAFEAEQREAEKQAELEQDIRNTRREMFSWEFPE